MECYGYQQELDEFREYVRRATSSLPEWQLWDMLFQTVIPSDEPPAPSPRRGRPKGSRSRAGRGSSTRTGPCARATGDRRPSGSSHRTWTRRSPGGPSSRTCESTACPGRLNNLRLRAFFALLRGSSRLRASITRRTAHRCWGHA
jgi:hypothetical protein